MIDKKYIENFDWTLFIAACLLTVFGLLTIYSATINTTAPFFQKQILWFSLSLVILFVITIIDYNFIERFGYFIYVGSVTLLLLALFIGKSAGGSQRWIDLGVINIQPSEIAKIAVIIALAKYFSSTNFPTNGLKIIDLIKPTMLVTLPFALTIKQPDLGTALIFILIYITILASIKIKLKHLLIIIFTTLPFLPFLWMHLKDYQKARILSFINPSLDPMGSGYHVLQSKIAIGSGSLTGTGYLEGKQGTLRFLPEQHTDFIFPILAEEWGLLGSMVMIILFITVIMAGITTAQNAKDRFGFFVSLGVTAMLFWHMLINIGMVTGLMPVVGVPLPFLSYGGSFLMTAFIGVALLINIRMRRFIF